MGEEEVEEEEREQQSSLLCSRIFVKMFDTFQGLWRVVVVDTHKTTEEQEEEE